ncbi:hypothetical protein Murru_2608 [Allomuricauda ruestringensis DSM 13258]|uniref:tRNA_anti-like n=1 Tax=Allomuricauda ruestringensis (strain DSM 13258 / CIP 107369 / LMG 19739 / B1) TaxID=886377 RepID=G2PQD7_ALLRU|nr:hypothetical protein [Allomuricauda ruestringensis]AEM71643.1 hypothetical protein Murru_2608 [Allomuricauda ruestringensis DSM 13258]
MPKKIKFLVFATLFGVALLFGWGLLGTKKTNVMNTSAEVEITAQNLLSVFNDGNQELMNGLKTEQIVEVTGLVKETNLMNGRMTVLLKGNNDSPPYIICDMMPHQKKTVSQFKPNDSVKIKGIFKGYLKDAVFLDCIVTFSQAND